jgi:hypothetical protein
LRELAGGGDAVPLASPTAAFHANQRVEVQYESVWYPGEVVELNLEHIVVRYDEDGSLQDVSAAEVRTKIRPVA